ncbi:hypothetical protein N7522_001181 [Penicillium canescens]|nr:hypothetical protein N7522_001181 [Penicillium canescens]
MSRCLHPGRILPFGRRPAILRLPYIPRRSVAPFSRPSWGRYIQERSKQDRKVNYPEELQFMRSYDDIAHPALKNGAKKNINNWMPLLERYVSTQVPKPAGQSGKLPPISDHEPYIEQAHALMGCLWDARAHYQYELLVHLGSNMKQWSTVHAILNRLIDTYELVAPHMTPVIPHLSSIGPDRFLESATGTDKLSQGTRERSRFKWCRIKPLSADKLSLDEMTVEPKARFFGEKILAEVLSNLGSLVLAAADSTPEESKLAMSCVFRILARLHHAGLISDRVYKYPTPDASQVAFRPPALHYLSSSIMSVLTDAAWHEHEAQVAAAAADAGEKSPFLPFKMGIRELGPEIWLELILWCCVEHGHSKEGALIVNRMLKRSGHQAWKAESWVPLLKDLNAVQQTNLSVEQSWRRHGQDRASQTFTGRQKPPFNGLGKRTISTEVLVSLRNGLANRAYQGLGENGYLPKELDKLSAPLTSLIDPPGAVDELRPTNMVSNWHIVRVMEAGCFYPWTDPVAFEALLRSNNNVVPPWTGSASDEARRLEEKKPLQFYDETAAIVGLIEFNLNCYARDRQSGRLFHEYAWLQNIIDASKTRHIETFFEELGQANDDDYSFFDSTRTVPQGVYETSVPQVSKVTLANILDLVTTTGAYEFGNQLIQPTDMDGPPIPRHLYQDQAVAPSLLRFAAASNNAELATDVIQALKTPLTVNTIKALINFHIARHNWDRVILMLTFMTDYHLKSWAYSNIIALSAEIIRLDGAIEQKKHDGTFTPADTKQLDRATDLFLRIFRGEFKVNKRERQGKFPQSVSYQDRVLYRMHRVLSTIPGIMPRILKDVKTHPGIISAMKIEMIPPSSFHVLFAAIVERHGAVFGKKFWDKWCVDWVSPRRRLQRPGGVSRLLYSHERDHRYGDPNFDPAWQRQIQTHATVADMTTVRILARAAVREYAEESQSLPNRHRQEQQIKQNVPAPKSDQHEDLTADDITQIFDPSITYKPTPQSAKLSQYPHGKPPITELESILDHCLRSFLLYGLPEDQLDIEIPGHLRRMQKRRLMATATGNNVRTRVKKNFEDPWMESSWPLHLATDVPESKEARNRRT